MANLKADSALVILEKSNENVILSSRNLKNLKVMTTDSSNAYAVSYTHLDVYKRQDI